MITFSAFVACLHVAACPIHNGFMLSHFDAESSESCEKFLGDVIEIGGHSRRDFAIVCSVEMRA